jgi:hypothetical protein
VINTCGTNTAFTGSTRWTALADTFYLSRGMGDLFCL